MADETDSTPEANGPKRVLVVMAHPDDGEFSCGGTIAHFAKQGMDVYYCLVTDGQVGDAGDTAITSEDLAAKRRREAQAAADALGVQHPVIFLHYYDSRVQHTLELRRDIARVIRQVRPAIVICQDPTRFFGGHNYINHPDHRLTGEATLAAIMPVAGTRLSDPVLAAEGLPTHEVAEVYIVGTDEPTRWVDVSDSIDTKVQALRAHASQLKDWDPTESVKQRAKETAQQARAHGHDMEYAEAFKYIKRA